MLVEGQMLAEYQGDANPVESDGVEAFGFGCRPWKGLGGTNGTDDRKAESEGDPGETRRSGWEEMVHGTGE